MRERKTCIGGSTAGHALGYVDPPHLGGHFLSTALGFVDPLHLGGNCYSLLWVLWTHLTLAVVFCPIQALVVQLSPKEAVVLAGETTPDSAKVKEVLGRSGLLITERKRGIVVCVISSSSPFGQSVNT